MITRFLVALHVLCFAASCDGGMPPQDGGLDASVDPTIIGVRYEPEGTGFYRIPWPSDARLTQEGTPDLSDLGTRQRLLVATAHEIEANVHGFANMVVAYFALTAPISDELLPVGLEALSPTSPIQMIDLSEDGCGGRVPLEVGFARSGDALRERNTLEVANAAGTVLEPGRPYGVIVLRSFGAAEARTTPRPEAFDRAIADAPGGDALWASLEPLRRCLPTTDVALDDVAVATVFTPQDPVAELRALRAAVVDPALETRPVTGWKPSEGWSRRRLELLTYTGTVQMPIFQDGVTPYETEGGSFVFDDSGRPIVQRWEEVEIAVAMRTFETPPAGPRPVLVFMDGTGWSPWNHVNDNWIREAALDRGYLVMSFMPQFHGGRAGFDGNTEVSTFNLPNPAAGRANFRQQAAETSYFVRLIREQIASQAGLPELDTENLVYGGHSQGALVGALVASVEDQFRGYVFNGLSSFLTETVLYREDLLDFSAVVQLLYGFTGDLDRFHPLVQLLQLGAEVVDPHNYVGRWRGWEGNPGGNHVFVVNGHDDATTTPRGIEHMTMAADMQPIDPPGWDVDPIGVWGGSSASLPVMGNATSFSGDPLTIATYLDLEQGHGTIYARPFARELAGTFWATARAGVPQLSSQAEYQCGDGADDDLDATLDCDDPDCASTPPCVEGPCDNTVDDDGNGLTDCDDPVCTTDAACREQVCDDRIDDDDDGAVDCDDGDCASRAPCAEGSCTDGVDGDADGATDCYDSDCGGARACIESCTNELDDDGDGDVDCDDGDCTTSSACPELMCTGGIDENENGLTDCADPGCAAAAACVRARETACADGRDDDRDGATDCADADCALFAACAASTCAHGDLGRQTGVALFELTLEGRRNDYPPGDCTPLGGGDETPDIALAWTAPAPGDYVFSTYGSEIDTVLTVLAPDCDPTREVGCNDDDGAVTTSRVVATLSADETVVVVINAYGARSAGSVLLHIYRGP